MPKPRRRKKPGRSARRSNTPAATVVTLDRNYDRACELVESENYAAAQEVYEELLRGEPTGSQRVLIENDLGTLAVLTGDLATARRRFQTALGFDKDYAVAKQNLALLEEEAAAPAQATVRALRHFCGSGVSPEFLITTGNMGEDAHATLSTGIAENPNSIGSATAPARVAIVSLLFNWPSTGGGTIHTWESAKFLARAGYDVRHFYAVFPQWGIGAVTEPLPVPGEPIPFEAASWTKAEIQRRFREAVDRFAPDYVIITDSWNSKPLLAEALRGYRYYLRLAAQECLCPLNNIRLLTDGEGNVSACPRHQLATPDLCRQCVSVNERLSGSLHQAERALAGYGTPDYDRQLRQAFQEAAGVLVVNPLIAAMVSPYAKAVHVIPSGFDPERFPWPWPEAEQPASSTGKTVLLFAGLVQEFMKGFHVLQAACAKLWQKRQDFELVVTADSQGELPPFLRCIGWQSQAELPKQLRAADIVIFPTIAEEALGRSAVEAMGVGRPVIASRIGGLPYTVSDGATGLLFEPGNSDDLVAKIEQLLDDPHLRHRLGDAGRKKFEQEFLWPTVIERRYRALLPPVPRTVTATPRNGDISEWGRNGMNSVLRRTVTATQRNGYQPRLPAVIDEGRLIAEAADFFSLPAADVRRRLDAYRGYHVAQRYAGRFGEFKTLSFEEAFLVGLLGSLGQPPLMVEIGSGTGRSARRLLDLRDFLGLKSQVVTYDVIDTLQHVSRSEVEFHVRDLTGTFRQEVLERPGSGLLFVDAHPYALLREIVTETLACPAPWILAIHDGTAGLCNPQMTLSKDDPEVTSFTGVWERYVLAEAFGISDPCSPELDCCRTASHRLRIFSTRHGLAVIAPCGMLGDRTTPDRISPRPRPLQESRS